MRSMTGYACRESESGGAYLIIELKSLNNRYLDLYVNIPNQFAPIESKIRELLQERLHRGKIECTVRYRPSGEAGGVSFDPHAARSLAAALEELRRAAGIEEEVLLSHLLRFEEQIRTEHPVDLDAAWDAIEPELVEALTALDAERVREGKSALASLREQLGVLAATLELFVDQAKLLDSTIRTQVRERFTEILGNRIEEDRILAEIASLLVRFSIEEEIVRFRGHLDAFEASLRSDSPVGKKLDFLCQELNREVNTIGSKSPLFVINTQVVEAKDAIEKMREQLRNVE